MSAQTVQWHVRVTLCPVCRLPTAVLWADCSAPPARRAVISLSLGCCGDENERAYKMQEHPRSSDFSDFSFSPLHHLLVPKYFTGNLAAGNELDTGKIIA